MTSVRNLWKTFSHTKALDKSSGILETDFFESVYRVTYITGLSTSDRSIGYLLYNSTVKILIACLVCGETWHAFTGTTSLDEVVSSLNVVVIQFISIYRYINMMENKQFYKNLATSMDSPYFDISTETRRKLVDTWAQRNERYLKLLLALGNATLAVWFIFPLADELEYNLIIGIHIPFNYRTPTLYVFTYIIVVISFLYIAHFVMVTDLIMQAHLTHLLCQFAVLADCFENVVDDCRNGLEGISKYDIVHNKDFADKYTKRLGNLVEQHKLILSHTKNLRSTLSGPMLGQLVGSGTMICFLGYQAATTITESIGQFLVSLLFLSYNAFEFYIICKWCEEITIWSNKIGEAVYSSGWECGVSTIKGVRSTILFVIACANKPLVFTAGGMCQLSIASYGSLLKASYSALTVLLRFRHD